MTIQIYFNFNWSWPIDNIIVKSSITKLGVLKNGIMETGIYRTKYNLQENGVYDPIWVTWVDLKTET